MLNWYTNSILYGKPHMELSLCRPRGVNNDLLSCVPSIVNIKKEFGRHAVETLLKLYPVLTMSIPNQLPHASPSRRRTLSRASQ
jgi:hypothetical protein